MRNGASFIGTIQGDANPNKSIPMLIDWYRKGRLPLDQIEKHFPAAAWKDAVDALHEGTLVKAILLW